MCQLNHKTSFILGKRIFWKKIEYASVDLFSNKVRRTKSTGLMVNLLILKQMEDPIVKTVIQAGVPNAYY